MNEMNLDIRAFDFGKNIKKRYFISINTEVFVMDDKPLTKNGFNEYIGSLDQLKWALGNIDEYEVSIYDLPGEVRYAIGEWVEEIKNNNLWLRYL